MNFKKITFNFHAAKAAREKYNFDQSLFTITGDLIIADFNQARILSEKINSKRKFEGKLDKLITAGQINALGLIHEICHFLIRFYEEKENPGVFSRAVTYLKNNIKEEDFNKILIEYINEFPPVEVFKGNISSENYLNGSSENKSNKEIIIEELILLSLENSNPAAINLEELFSDKNLLAKSKYLEAIELIDRFFASEKPFGSENLSLIHFLRKPVIESPYSLESQLDFIREKWGSFIFEKFNERLLKSKDLIMEDAKLFLHGGGEKATPPVPFYNPQKQKSKPKNLTEDEENLLYPETEQFTQDIDWMPKVVMIAKNAFVWLNQLSKKYQREINTLDQIPDEELDNLARWNFTSLWLIGIWERSSASKKIKQLTGNSEAASSAYSLYDYVISSGLGGESAFENLKYRAGLRKIKLASDMVPNHTGIYSKWVIEKPGYFIQTKFPPYPNYTFNGPNLSDDNRVEIRIEDKYYSHEDAAVVFQRKDSYTGDNVYIYHGNDGTHMPWNDTAQLNLLNPEVRESLIQTIMHVARKTPIIRFDAAMTLAKKHFQRLWFPQPGTGGAIPSRSDFSMTRGTFDEAMPIEFWREVVDRINTEMPETLLLAEAFWLMEGYFVRTLGMHRVYNSAFMHMMMKEENDKYKQLIKNTLEFNPEILKRYVNFMSNPDEETAVNQFGKGDKYFGVTILMITFPGLPMFAHGQVEGLSEKYGMEYTRAYYDEHPDQNLISRHEYEIFPLIKKRKLFSQVQNFELYDLIDNSGNINGNVFAFSNYNDGARALILYNNSYFECAGTINYSSNKMQNNYLANKKVSEALRIKDDQKYFYSCRDHKTKLEYLFRGNDVHSFGLYFHLQGYQYHVFLDFKEIFDTDGNYEKIYHSIANKGVYSIEQIQIELNLQPLHDSLREILNDQLINEFLSFNRKENLFLKKLEMLLNEIENYTQIKFDKEKVTNKIENDLKYLKIFFSTIIKETGEKNVSKWLVGISNKINIPENRNLFFCFYILKNVLPAVDQNYALFDELRLYNPVSNSLKTLKQIDIHEQISLIKILSFRGDNLILNDTKLISPKNKLNFNKKFIKEIFDNNEISAFLNVNEFEGIKYFSKEKFELLINWVFNFSASFSIKNFIKQNNKSSGNKNSELKINSANFKKELKEINDFFEDLIEKSESSGYMVDNMKKSAVVSNFKKEKKSPQRKNAKNKRRKKK